jgi:hypothetical protein
MALEDDCPGSCQEGEVLEGRSPHTYREWEAAVGVRKWCLVRSVAWEGVEAVSRAVRQICISAP